MKSLTSRGPATGTYIGIVTTEAPPPCLRVSSAAGGYLCPDPTLLPPIKNQKSKILSANASCHIGNWTREVSDAAASVADAARKRSLLMRL